MMPFIEHVCKGFAWFRVQPKFHAGINHICQWSHREPHIHNGIPTTGPVSELTGEQKVFAATHLCISRWRVCVTFFVVVFIQKNAAKFFVRLTFAGFVRSLWFPFFFPRKPWRGPTASRPLPRGALQLSRLGLRLFGHFLWGGCQGGCGWAHQKKHSSRFVRDAGWMIWWKSRFLMCIETSACHKAGI